MNKTLLSGIMAAVIALSGAGRGDLNDDTLTEKPVEGKPPVFESIGGQTSSQAARVLELTNERRAAAGLDPLKSDAGLDRLAQWKAEDMAEQGYFSHNSPTYGSAFDMLKAAGITYKSAGENIASGQSSAATVLDGWMGSASHRANILDSGYTHLGVGYATDDKGKTYWVQIFLEQ